MIQLRSGRKAEYFKVHLPSSIQYECEWFYVRNVVGSASPFTDRESVSMQERQHGREASLKIEVENMFMIVKMLKQQGLSSARLV